MSTFTQIIYQIVFGSKYITPFLDSSNQDKLFNYMAGTARNKNCIPYKIGGHKNHVHMIVSIHPTIALCRLVRDVKYAADLMMKREKTLFKNFPGWQRGYGGFTYSFSARDNLIRYVINQEQHHKKENFEEEFIRLLDEHGIEYDRKYLFI